MLCEFRLDKNHIEKISWNTFQYIGIYLFKIKNNNLYKDFHSWVSNFKNKWMQPKYVKSFTPNLTKKRVLDHEVLDE